MSSEKLKTTYSSNLPNDKGRLQPRSTTSSEDAAEKHENKDERVIMIYLFISITTFVVLLSIVISCIINYCKKQTSN